MAKAVNLDGFRENLVSHLRGERGSGLREGEAGQDRADRLLRAYWYDEPFTGRHFDRVRDIEHPNQITEKDLLAVTMLGVQVPAAVAIWILSPDGRAQIEDRLARIPISAQLHLHSELLQPRGDCDELWCLLRCGNWPVATDANGMGRTTISKLLSAKRPGLIPIFDSVVRDLLGEVPNHWDAFRHALNPDVVDLATEVTRAAPPSVTLLRKIDSLLWMIGTHPDAGVKPATAPTRAG